MLNDWYKDAECLGMDTDTFFEKYEYDAGMATAIDNICLDCPVAKECFDYGAETDSWGVWGGVFLVDGKPDNSRNSHKSQEIWKQVLENING